MIGIHRINIILRNNNEELNLYFTDIDDWEHEIEIYSNFRHPNLKRGWTGDLIYHCAHGVNISDLTDIKNIELDCLKDVLLRSVQCYSANDDEAVVWKYTFLKD